MIIWNDFHAVKELAKARSERYIREREIFQIKQQISKRRGASSFRGRFLSGLGHRLENWGCYLQVRYSTTPDSPSPAC